MKKYFFYPGLILASAFILAGCILVQPTVQPEASPSPAASPKKSVIKASFNCAGGKSIQAEFNQGEVKLTLSDGRSWVLPQAMSGSGARYANSDETQVFWNKGDTAFIEENGQTTFSDCVTVNQ